jgi:hypothetical protein
MSSLVILEEEKDNDINKEKNNDINKEKDNEENGNKIKNKKIVIFISLIAAYGLNLALFTDLNIDFGNNKRIVNNSLFQFILLFSSSYLITEDYKYSLVLPIIYFMLK